MSSQGSSSSWIYYVDESYDTTKFCLVALGLKGATWKQAFDSVKAFRTEINATDGIYYRTELHAKKFTKGLGEVGPRVVTKWRRTRVFFDALQLIASLPDIHIFNICLDVRGRADPQLDAWDRLLNRINRTCEQRNRQENSRRRDLLSKVETNLSPHEYESLEKRLIPYSSHAMIISDNGRESEIVRLRRKLSVYNHIRSKYGRWPSGATKNIPLTHFIEDTLFRDSAHSYFIQLADFAAFALLKRETIPTAHVKKYGLNMAWDKYLQGVSYSQASASDPHGIVRK